MYSDSNNPNFQKDYKLTLRFTADPDVLTSKSCPFHVYKSARKLEEELDGWLREAGITKNPDVRAIIAP